MFVLQKPARGLLGALGLKILGRSPTGFEEAVRGVVSLDELYLADQLELVEDAGAASTFTVPNTAGGSLTVPSGETWHVKGVSGYLLRNVADIAVSAIAGIDLALVAAAGPRLSLGNVALGTTVAANLSQPFSMTQNLPHDLWLPPGARMQYLNESTFAQPAQGGIVALIHRVPL